MVNGRSGVNEKKDKRIKKSVWFGKGIALMCLFVCVLESTYAYM